MIANSGEREELEQFEVRTISELEAVIAQFGDNVLFRGQNSLYGKQEVPSVLASFDRDECNKSTMIKWISYAASVLEGVIGSHANDLEYVQALLQHYGWRSFYVDCTTNPAVAAWFASHKCSLSIKPSPPPKIDMCEDCNENPIWLIKKAVRYYYEDGDGYLYILDKSLASRLGLVDLSDIEIKGFRPRMQAQDAWLLGPLYGEPVPENCFIAQIKASRSLLKQYAVLNAITDTNSLFPSVTEDPILKELLDLPWREVEQLRDPNIDIPVFKRSLELPEYHDSYVKNVSPSIAFYRGGKIAELFDSIETMRGELTGGVTISSPSIILFGTDNDNSPLRLPKIERLLKGKNYVAFEIDELIKHVNKDFQAVYQKGIGIICHETDLIEVCELVVVHPGMYMQNAGFRLGWFYRKNSDGVWVREPCENECGCGNDMIHEKHISALRIAEYCLRP